MSNIMRKFKLAKHRIDQAVLNQVRKANGIVFGGQAIKRKLGINARPTKDIDAFVNMPKKVAAKTEAKLDRLLKKDAFFLKKGKNISTHKVKFKGGDNIAGTPDDLSVADFTKTPKPEPKTFKFRNVRYRILQEELNAKLRLIRGEEFKFRSKKDEEDAIRILKFSNLGRKR